ncbi:MAG: serine dehydratase [Bacteroidetes bacterium GWE2_41_25]|nr:MAG: serine dehydratase [Bacteroidetes bacterium GWA2_40_15]OFX86609.1 MAG: serine dehydratase [Bacteroidetes bacterium GWC2_40_22]OFY04365.1 MAG: serine dehydratase [Bacteroidetes bacterium GWE2_41_25]OFY57984.1 MAG: serine dehydratase [Bacteroidetes bacterium GWF2_41_9]HAM08774.1 serine dehydratase [Bacteroidales bacterium]
MTLPSLSDIQSANLRISPFIHCTPVLTSQLLNSIFECELFFKCENFQKVGAFKFRGAANAILLLNDEEKKMGVVTHSSGNHAAALALAAKINGVKATIVMPETSPVVKKNAVAGYGAEIMFCKPTLQAREETTRMIMERTGAKLIHPYDNFNVICGQGTASLELLNEKPDLDFVIAPIGGGGLMSGTSTCVKGINSKIKVIGAEPLNANDAWKSFTTGQLVPSVNPLTVADGLLTSLSELTFTIIKKNVDQILTATEESIVECMLLVWERMKIIIEPSSATVLAVIRENPGMFRGKKAGLIISGGNVDFRKLPF